MPDFTPEQEKAIYDRGKDILVSASAGAGKTTVLVERVLNQILTGIPVSKMLIITFTKAAASEMKERIKTQISVRLENDRDNDFLRQQMLEIDTANISTIDAFCLDVIRRFYYVIELDPSFSILTDDTQSTLLQERALTELEKEHLEKQDSKFIQFYDNFSGEREADTARDLLYSLYSEAMAQPNYKDFLTNLANSYDLEDSLVKSPLWQNSIKPYLLSQLEDIQSHIQSFLETSQFETKELSKQRDSFTLFSQNLAHLITAITEDEDYNEQRELFRSCQFTGNPRKSKKWDEDLLEIYEESYDYKKEVNDRLKKIFVKFYIEDEEKQKAILKQSKDIVEEIGKIELEFIERFNQLKREQNLIDYSDMEHFAYEILTQGSSKSNLAKEYYQRRFSEILVDEYQDVNELQEHIIQSIKKKGKNSLFMVGDVKQSIYGFRQARPQLFLEKYHAYQEENDEHERILLSDNFRSTKNVTETVNKLFIPLLTSDFGGIDYKKEGQLNFGAKYYPDGLGTVSEFIFTDAQERQEETEEDDETDFAEIQMVIERIKQLMAEGFTVYDPKIKAKRPLRYEDIAILSRTRSSNLQIMEEFAKNNLPLFVTDAQNYFQTFELVMIMSYLKIIDNPRQDIPLVAVLRSPLFSFTEPELAKIRIKTRRGDFYEAIGAYASENNALGEKCNNFLKQLEELRQFATTHRISELIWTIYEKTHLLEIVTSLPNGRQRRVNLESLYERANSYETAGFKGLYQFISFIERMRKNQKDLAQPLLSDEANDSVKLMTIHASKGLEFPVVFVVGLNHQYRKTDISNPYSIDPKLGLGLTLKQTHYRVDSLVKSMGDVEKQEQDLEEEARILYVALTRARQKLILVASVRKLEDKFKKLENNLDKRGFLSPAQKINATSPLDLLGPRLVTDLKIRNKLSDMTLAMEERKGIVYLEYKTSSEEESEVEKQEYKSLDNDSLLNVAKKLYDFSYPFEDATQTTAYQAVSEIKTAFNDPVDKELENSQLIKSANRYLQPIDETPQFLKETKFTGAEIGTATHLILQYFDYTKEKIDLQAEIDRLINEGKLNEDIVNDLPLDSVKWFVGSDLAQKFWRDPSKLVREQEFSSLLPATDIFENFSDPSSQILVHGTIDGYFEDKDGIILFDYKTDYIDKSHLDTAIEKIKEKYSGQLRLYEMALNSFSNKKVKSKYLVLLDANKLVELK